MNAKISPELNKRLNHESIHFLPKRFTPLLIYLNVQ